MFPLLIESFLTRGSNEISSTVALGRCFLAEIPDSIIQGIMVKIVCSGKNEEILELLEKFKFCIIHNTC